MKTTLYRVQDREGRGPWKPGFSKTWTGRRPLEELAKLKDWQGEFGPLKKEISQAMRKGHHVGCACRDLDQLRLWFSLPEYLTLLSVGYSAVVMDNCTIIAESDIQCVFSRPHPLRAVAAAVQLF